MPASAPGRPRVGLFVTCLVDLFRPSVGFAAAKLLADAGCDVDVPATQTCCGQPAYNSGDKATAEQLARLTIAAFEAHDYVVAPSGSCAGMLKLHYPALVAADPAWKARAAAFAGKVHELVSFLVDVRGVKAVDAALDARVTYHDSCSGLRELGIREQPRVLLRSVHGLKVVELATPTCAAASAAPSRSSIRTSPTPSSSARPSRSRPPAPTCCSPATSAA